MFHSEDASERCVGFDDNVVALAEGSEFCPGIEWINFDLVDCRGDARLRS